MPDYNIVLPSEINRNARAYPKKIQKATRRNTEHTLCLRTS